MSVLKLEDLKVWQEGRVLCSETYKLLKKYPLDEKYNLIKHMKENGRGIPANIAEGFYRFHYKDCIRFYFIARGCLGEFKSDIYISHDLFYITDDEFCSFLQKIEKIIIMLNSLIRKSKEIGNSYNT
jgi:four helix bundle protein